MAGKTNRKHGRNKTRSPAMARYRAEGRMEKNRKLRANRQARIEAAHAAKRLAVTAKRKRGAVARLERRIAAGAKNLEATLAKAKNAANNAQVSP
jgi:hypothetical protein